MSNKLVMWYPKDPPIQCLEMNRQEFLEAFPRRPILVYSDKGVSGIPMEPDEIWCDTCGADPGDYIFLYNGTKAICLDCAER